MAMPIVPIIYNPNNDENFIDSEFYAYKDIKKLIVKVFNLKNWQIKSDGKYLYICFLDFKYYNRGKGFSYILEDFLKCKNYVIEDRQLENDWIFFKCKCKENVKEQNHVKESLLNEDEPNFNFNYELQKTF